LLYQAAGQKTEKGEIGMAFWNSIFILLGFVPQPTMRVPLVLRTPAANCRCHPRRAIFLTIAEIKSSIKGSFEKMPKNIQF